MIVGIKLIRITGHRTAGCVFIIVLVFGSNISLSAGKAKNIQVKCHVK